MTRPSTRPDKSAADSARHPLPSTVFERLEVRQMLSGNGTDDGGATDSSPAIYTMPNQHPNRNVDPIRMFTWHDWDLDGATPMVWVYSENKTPQQAFDATIDQLRNIPEGERAIFLWRFGHAVGDTPFDQVLANNGYDMTQEAQWNREYFTLLRNAGVTPDYVILDHEQGDGYWHHGIDEVRRLVTDPANRSRLPDQITSIPLEDWSYGADGWEDAVLAWNDYFMVKKNDALNAAITAVGNEVFGQGVSYSNYQSAAGSFTTFDTNNWRYDPSAQPGFGNASSPMTYLSGSGNRYRNAADPGYERMLDNLNRVRSALNVHDDVSPWVAYPSHDGDVAIWAQQMRQFRASGVNTFLMFNPLRREVNPDQYEADRAMLQSMINELNQMSLETQTSEFTSLDRNTTRLFTNGYGYDHSTGQHWQHFETLGTTDPNAGNRNIVHSGRTAQGDLGISAGPNVVNLPNVDQPVLVATFDVKAVKHHLAGTAATLNNTDKGLERVQRLALIDELDGDDDDDVTVDVTVDPVSDPGLDPTVDLTPDRDSKNKE